MREIKYLLVLLVVLLFASCTEVHFQQPQPIGKKETLTIQKKYLGTYYYRDTTLKITDDSLFMKLFPSEVGGSPDLVVNKVLSIYPQMVMRGYDGKLIFNKKQTEIADKMGWNDDTIVKMFSIEKNFLKSNRKDGFLSYYYNAMDTLISLSRGDVVKKYKGHLYLNKNDGEDDWIVYQLKKSHKKIYFNSLNSDDEDLLKTICPIEKGKHYNPTIKQFKLFLKKGGFQKKEEYLLY